MIEMIGMMIRILSTMAMCACFCACSFVSPQQHALTKDLAKSLSLLEGQAESLTSHEAQLASLADSQHQLARELVRLNRQLDGLNTSISNLSMPSSEGSQDKVEDAESAIETLDTPPTAKVVLGAVEWVWVESLKVNFKARVDTGASSSSIDASDIQEFERNGEPWVRFVVNHSRGALADKSGIASSLEPSSDEETSTFEKSSTIEAPVFRYANVRQSSVGERERRPVVILKITLGDIVEETAFTLSDRSHMLYPLLLGRSFLRDIAMVDVASKFTRKKHRAIDEVAEQ